MISACLTPVLGFPSRPCGSPTKPTRRRSASGFYSVRASLIGGWRRGNAEGACVTTRTKSERLDERSVGSASGCVLQMMRVLNHPPRNRKMGNLTSFYRSEEPDSMKLPNRFTCVFEPKSPPNRFEPHFTLFSPSLSRVKKTRKSGSNGSERFGVTLKTYSGCSFCPPVSRARAPFNWSQHL